MDGVGTPSRGAHARGDRALISQVGIEYPQKALQLVCGGGGFVRRLRRARHTAVAHPLQHGAHTAKEEPTMAGKESNAIELLKHDHREVDSMFKQFDAEDETRSKAEIAQHICLSLIVHSEIEEELFYPAAQRALEDEDRDLVAEAKVEHLSLKRLINDISGSRSGDEMFDARMTVLKEYVKHHVHEEEHELMPQVKKTDVDLEALGSRLLERKQALIQEYRSYAEQQSGSSINLPPLAIATHPHKTGAGGKHATHARVNAPSRSR
jgi:hypothetical protein